MTTDAIYEECRSDWSHQVSAVGTTLWLQCDQTLSAKGVACETTAWDGDVNVVSCPDPTQLTWEESVIVKNEFHNITLSGYSWSTCFRFRIILINAALRSDGRSKLLELAQGFGLVTLDPSLVSRPHPLTRRNSLVNQVEFLGLAHAFATL